MVELSGKIEEEVHVTTYTDIIGPTTNVGGTIQNSGRIKFGTVPGCWGPLITPQLRSGHEVTLPVNVVGAEVGDGLALHIEKVEVQSIATLSGVDDKGNPKFFGADATVDRKCPGCGRESPETYISGIGPDAVRCTNCNTPANPFKVVHGYIMAFDEIRKIGLTVGPEWSNRIAKMARKYSALDHYPNAISHSSLVLGASDMPGFLARVRPMIGNIGTLPSKDIPSHLNAGDIGPHLVGAKHKFSLTEDELNQAKTDGHMDIDSVREGVILICPVKVQGGGVYCGDVHAMQGDGELAGHTTDVVAEVVVKAEIVKGIGIDGPILIPREEDLPYLVRPYNKDEIQKGKKLAELYGTRFIEEVAPIQIIGTGQTINEATENGLKRTAALLGESLEKTRNRATITGCVEIGRLPGVVTISVLAPFERLEELKIADLVSQMYKLEFL